MDYNKNYLYQYHIIQYTNIVHILMNMNLKIYYFLLTKI